MVHRHPQCPQPKPWGAPLLADVRLHQLGHNYGQWSSFAELLRGGSVTLTRQARGCVYPLLFPQ